MPFFDTHAHYYFPEFSQDQHESIERARKAGIEWMVNVGTGPETSRLSLELAQKYEFIWASAGIHPTDALEGSEENIQAVEALLNHPRVVAIGEVGLDFYHKDAPPEVQEKLLRRFLAIYRNIQKPLIIHCRDAYQALYEIFVSEAAGGAYRGVMHCFSSDAEDMKRFAALGFHISFAGPLTYKKNDVLREACRLCPADRILLETDAPFLPPQSMRGKRNESSLMLETADMAAQVRGVSLEEIGRLTSENARKLFGLC